MDATNIGHTPRSLRVRLGLTQNQVAEDSGASERTVRVLEEGGDVTLNTLRKIAPVLQVSVEELVSAIDHERARREVADE